MEKKPEELGKIFELVVDRSEKLLSNIFLLETDLKSIYEANVKVMRNTVDSEELIEHLDRIKIPVEFLKAKEEVFEELSADLRRYEILRDELDTRSSKDLPKKTKKIFALMDFLPKKIEPLSERYIILNDLLSADGLVDSIFNQLEKINNRKINQIFKKDLWKKRIMKLIFISTLRLLILN